MSGRNKRKKFGNIIAHTITIIGLACTLVWNYCQHKQINKADYLSRASYEPVLDVIGDPSLEAFAMTPSDTVKFNERGALADLPVDIKILGRLKLVNRGNHSARLLAFAVADTLSSSAIMRKRMLAPERAFVVDYVPDFRTLVIQPEDTLELPFVREIQFIKGNAGVFHFLILYENDYEIIFDTYIWARFEQNELVGRATEFQLGFARRDLSNFIQIKETIDDPSRYSQDESEQLLDYMRTMAEENDTVPECKMEITHVNTKVYRPETEIETWLITSKIKRAGNLTPRNVYSHVWFDTLSYPAYNFEETFPGRQLRGWALLDSMEERLGLKKSFVNDLYDRGHDVYKHILIRYEDYLGIDYESELTQRLSINNHKITWETVRDTTYSP